MKFLTIAALLMSSSHFEVCDAASVRAGFFEDSLWGGDSGLA